MPFYNLYTAVIYTLQSYFSGNIQIFLLNMSLDMLKLASCCDLCLKITIKYKTN